MKLYKVKVKKPSYQESYKHIKKLHAEDPELFLSPKEWLELHKRRHIDCSVLEALKTG